MDWCTLLNCKSVGVGVGVGVGPFFSDNSHNPVLSSCAPTINVLCCFVIITSLLVKVASHLALPIFPIDSNEICVNPGIMCAALDCWGSCGKQSLHYVDDDNRFPLGRVTLICGMMEGTCGTECCG